jgi:hypothetical protein
LADDLDFADSLEELLPPPPALGPLHPGARITAEQVVRACIEISCFASPTSAFVSVGCDHNTWVHAKRVAPDSVDLFWPWLVACVEIAEAFARKTATDALRRRVLGGDQKAIEFFLSRRGGREWAPPAAPSTTVVVDAGGAAPGVVTSTTSQLVDLLHRALTDGGPGNDAPLSVRELLRAPRQVVDATCTDAPPTTDGPNGDPVPPPVRAVPTLRRRPPAK